MRTKKLIDNEQRFLHRQQHPTALSFPQSISIEPQSDSPTELLISDTVEKSL
ncbi:hypothetical protein OIU79_006654 [Salix purpurea]|uniref:Uncharacterized protein n=1 Tax=Salix purpurea TaxID=77065 RepID=A0A9Q0TVZ6_SALPP|nr:hypothetical protein OIU79_006654 [Salix purpurea]